MKASLDGRRVVVTAAASGIGRAIAEAYLAAGARVHIGDISEAELRAIQSVAPGLDATIADVADPAQVDRLFDAVLDRFGGLDVLVNNAGIAGPTGPIENLSLVDWQRTMLVNIDGMFLCCRRAVPLLRQSAGGSIVNIASTAGIMGYPLRAPYAASKYAVVGLTKTLAMELGSDRIRVNALCPGPIEGERMERIVAAEAAARGTSQAAIRAGYVKQTSLRSFIPPSDIANMAVFLSSPLGAKISGQIISVDGNTETLRN